MFISQNAYLLFISKSCKRNNNLPHIFGGSRKGAKPYQEDSCFSFISDSALTYIGGVFDGHGGYNGYLASSTARDYAVHFFETNADMLDTWSIPLWNRAQQARV